MKGFLRMKAQEIDHAALRQRFNPDGSLLRRQQMRMLEILLEVDRICKKHDIKYWLSSGTLIGAARHKGFIPWDDDLDIEMLWDDYKRLMKVLPDELPETMALQNTKTDPNYFCFYAKVRDRRSHLEESNRYDRVWREQGIYIDVFPFYRQPLWIHMLSEKAQGHVYKIMNRRRPTPALPEREGTNTPSNANPHSESHTAPSLTGRAGGGPFPPDFWKVRFITRFNEKFFFPLLRFFCKFSNARETDGLGIPFHDPRHMEDILPLSQMEFEGHMFPVPHDTHAVLTLKYGDYMQLPDIDKINLHVGTLTIDD